MEKTNGKKPKVEIGLNQEARLTLNTDKAYVGQNSYGPFYLYSVYDDGTEKSFFASADIHQRILESGLRRGDQFLVRKKAIQDGRKVLAKIEFEVLNKKETPANGNGNGGGTGDNLKDVLLQCVKDADFIMKNAEGQVSDPAQKLATALFIARTRMS